MTRFLRRKDDGTTTASAPTPPPDSPAVLMRGVYDLINLINVNSGRLPVEAVVAARQVTDLMRELIDTAGDRELDVYVVVAVTGIVTDYLPTTLRSYLALDPSLVDTPRSSGRTPSQSVVEQIESLWDSAADLLDATRTRDADAVLTHGNFLRTKFTRSDLDL
jgi:hypothetical protein